MKRDIVEIYKECGNFHQAVKESGLPALVAHVKQQNASLNFFKNAVKNLQELNKELKWEEKNNEYLRKITKG